jgi:glycosyltransferase involved in cell wall biosynthesis
MKVLMLNSVMNGGGVDSHTLSLCRALTLEGCELVLAVPHCSRWAARAAALPNVEVLMLGARGASWIVPLARFLRHHEIDIIHAHHGRDYWLAILLRILSGKQVRVVVTRHLMTRLRARTRKMLAATAGVIAVSDAVLAAIRSVDPGRTLKLQRIHCGVDTDYFRRTDSLREQIRQEFGIPRKAWVYAMIGGAQRPHGKGQRYFLDAAGIVHARHRNAMFLCVGDGDMVPELEAIASTLGLERRVRFMPFEENIARLLQTVDVLVHPPAESEALGLVILEALSCGIPVVATALDGVPETFIPDEHGLLVPPADVGALAEAMLAMASSPQRTVEMGARGPAWIHHNFSLASMGRATLALYRESLRRAPTIH